MANDDFSEPPQRADSKNTIFIFSRFLGLGHLQGLGVRLSMILGVLSIEPFLGEGGDRQEGSIDPPPPRKRKPGLPSRCCFQRFQDLGIWRLLLPVAHECDVSSVGWRWGWDVGDADCCPAPRSHPGLSLGGGDGPNPGMPRTIPRAAARPSSVGVLCLRVFVFFLSGVRQYPQI